MEHDGLDGEARAEAEEHAPIQALPSGGVAFLGRALTHLVQNEEDARTGHVAVLREDMPGGMHPLLVEIGLRLHHV